MSDITLDDVVRFAAPMMTGKRRREWQSILRRDKDRAVDIGMGHVLLWAMGDVLNAPLKTWKIEPGRARCVPRAFPYPKKLGLKVRAAFERHLEQHPPPHMAFEVVGIAKGWWYVLVVTPILIPPQTGGPDATE